MENLSDSTAAASGTPGENIRALRKRNGMTLSDVSARTGLAISTISKLEKGQLSLTYDKLMLLSKGLAVDIAELLDPKPRTPTAGSTAGGKATGGGPAGATAGAGGRRIVHRAGEGQLIETRSYRHLYLATELLNKHFTPLVSEARARTIQEYLAEFGDFIRHPGQEFALVLEGEIEFHTELYAPLRLKTGDSVYFDSEMGHAYLKGSNGACRIVSVSSPGAGDGEVIETLVNASQRHARNLAQSPASPPRVVRSKPRTAK
jgi:transcriptional regulator with XRE-family HTH domain